MMRTPAATDVMLISTESTIAPPSYCAWICIKAGEALVTVKNTESPLSESIMPYCG